MGKKPYTAIAGFGIGLVMWILEMADATIPLMLLIILGVVALGMVVFGGIPIVISVSHGLHRVKFRTPVTIVPSQSTKQGIQQIKEQQAKEPSGTIYPIQVKDTLDELIRGGKYLCDEMQAKDFNYEDIESVVHQWLDDGSCEVWEIIPEQANYIVGDQGELTEGEKLRYQGWKWDAAALRISVDRRLARLREIRSQIQVLDKEGSES